MLYISLKKNLLPMRPIRYCIYLYYLSLSFRRLRPHYVDYDSTTTSVSDEVVVDESLNSSNRDKCSNE